MAPRRALDSAPEERRASRRLDKAFTVFLEGPRGNGLGVARNISAGGLFVETRVPERIGAQVRVTFPSGEGDLTAIAEVRYVTHLLGRTGAPGHGPVAVRGMGLQFLYFEPGTTAPRLQ